ncbi:sensor histidine kinase [Herbaspirillum sp. RV1423]|uniref:sensor histidine kinase n=1 Tax=Herbaspirillum sp. RV1423 TaxID=1443993 RepID=UPI0004B098E0|nr:sensor histidine kinase [Herbaspirillum sp. RV1423]
MMSLRQRLLIIIGFSLTILWALVAVWMFLDVRQEIRTALDERLAASARMVAGLVSQLPSPNTPVDGRAGSPLDVISRDGLACEVSLLRGEVLAQTMARTVDSPGLSNVALGYGTHTFGGKPWRTYVLEQGGIRIATADRIDLREGLLRDIALSVGIPFVVALAGSLLLLWFGIGRGLQPIERVRVALAQRRPDDEIPLPAIDAPPELRPLVETIRCLLQKVHGAIARERRFTGDAAHELRTPLTAIKTHLQVAQLVSIRHEATDGMSQALSSANEGVLQLQTTLDQLLLLARLDASVEHAQVSGWGVTGAAVKQALSNLTGSHHEETRVELQMEPTVSEMRIALPDALLISALRNLLDNALRHSPPASKVLLRVERKDDANLCFSVLDEGPGLTPGECRHAVERFWRKESSGKGSGLGLSIVNAITNSFGGSLTLKPRSERGLEVCLIVPVSSS